MAKRRKRRRFGRHKHITEAKEAQAGIKIADDAGLGNSTGDSEWIPAYNRAENEIDLSMAGRGSIKKTENSWILLGRDRFASPYTGKGGMGDHGAASIDLVVGMGNVEAGDLPDSFISNFITTPGTIAPGIPIIGTLWDKNFKTDAARVYISQKADIDRYFDIDPGKGYSGIDNSVDRSAVGIKADAIRIIGREGIRLVTRTESKNSQDGKLRKTSGIELMAGGDPTNLQPIVKGGNLARALQKLAELVQQLVRNIDKLAEETMQMGVDLSMHMHPTAAPGPPSTALSIIAPVVGDPIDVASALQMSVGRLASVRMDTMATGKRIGVGWKGTYAQAGGQYYINSYYNKVN